MKSRTPLATALTLLALAAPAANAQIPSDHDGTSSTPPQASGHPAQTTGCRTAPTTARTAPAHNNNQASYNPLAYVPGGAPPSVAKAITDAARRATT
jgi:hypothetical protein